MALRIVKKQNEESITGSGLDNYINRESGIKEPVIEKIYENTQDWSARMSDLDFRNLQAKVDYPEVLPFSNYVGEIKESLENNDFLILVGATGSGKSTQIGKVLIEMGYKSISHTQPRVIAATSCSARIADEMNVSLGQEVGYKVRFDKNTKNSQTALQICTDGILLQELKIDPTLKRYDAIVVDESHERSLNIDLLLGLLKETQKKRKEFGLKPLKIVLASATIKPEVFADYFGELNNGKEVPIMNVEGRTFPVDVKYDSETITDFDKKDPITQKTGLDKIIDKGVNKIGEILSTTSTGDIIVFCNGEAVISKFIKLCEENGYNKNSELLPLYSKLNPDEQNKVFEKTQKRKIIFATNIAETSVTLPDLKYGIDTGLVNQTNFHPDGGIQSLDLQYTSKASADQRAGRLGRVQSGVMYRLYSQDYFNKEMLEFTTPEIHRTDLSHLVLQMKSMGIEDVFNFDFIERPDLGSFHRAYDDLKLLGALDKNGDITDFGYEMSRIPVEPKLAKTLLFAEKYDCQIEAIAIAATQSVPNIFFKPKDENEQSIALQRRHSFKLKEGSDLLLEFNVFLQFKKLYEEKNYKELKNFCLDNYLNKKQLENAYKIYIDLLKNLKIRGYPKESYKDDELRKIDLAMASGMIGNLCTQTKSNSYYNSARYESKDVGGIMLGKDSLLEGEQLFVASKIMTINDRFTFANGNIRLIDYFREDPLLIEELIPESAQADLYPIIISAGIDIDISNKPDVLLGLFSRDKSMASEYIIKYGYNEDIDFMKELIKLDVDGYISSHLDRFNLRGEILNLVSLNAKNEIPHDFYWSLWRLRNLDKANLINLLVNSTTWDINEYVLANTYSFDSSISLSEDEIEHILSKNISLTKSFLQDLLYAINNPKKFGFEKAMSMISAYQSEKLLAIIEDFEFSEDEARKIVDKLFEKHFNGIDLIEKLPKNKYLDEKHIVALFISKSSNLDYAYRNFEKLGIKFLDDIFRRKIIASYNNEWSLSRLVSEIYSRLDNIEDLNSIIETFPVQNSIYSELTNFIGKGQKFNNQIARNFIKLGKTQIVLDNPTSFEELDNNTIKFLKQKGFLDDKKTQEVKNDSSVLDGLDEFHRELDNDMIEMIFEEMENNPMDVAGQFEVDQLVVRLHSLGEVGELDAKSKIEYLLKNHESVPDLNPIYGYELKWEKLYENLHNLGYDDLISKYLYAFEGVKQYLVAKRLINSGFSENIKTIIPRLKLSSHDKDELKKLVK